MARSENLSCDPSTCPPGPVKLVFEYSNCTGEIEYSTAPLPRWNVCVNTTLPYGDGPSSYIEFYNDEYEEKVSYRGSENCSDLNDQATRAGSRRYFGTCVNHVMHLANANQTFISPQNPELNPIPDVPLYQTAHVECSSPSACLAISGYYTAYSRNNSCPLTSPYYYVSPNALNTCYRREDGSGYTMIRCLGPHTAETNRFLNSDCTRPTISAISGAECVRSYASTIFCVNTSPAPGVHPYTPPTPSAPLSPSSSSGEMAGFSVLAIILSLIAALIM